MKHVHATAAHDGERASSSSSMQRPGTSSSSFTRNGARPRRRYGRRQGVHLPKVCCRRCIMLVGISSSETRADARNRLATARSSLLFGVVVGEVVELCRILLWSPASIFLPTRSADGDRCNPATVIGLRLSGFALAPSPHGGIL